WVARRDGCTDVTMAIIDAHMPILGPRAVDPRDRGGPAQPMLIARDLKKHFPVKGARGKSVQAVDGVSFDVQKGETLGIVGESGCGKSTLARLLLHLIAPDAGELVFDGDAVDVPNGIRVDALRRQVQMVFQDSYASLNPRMPIRDSVAFGPFIQGKKRPAAREIAWVMELGPVGELGPADAIFAQPQHPYTRALLGSRPSMDPARRIEEPPITGDPPNPIDPPSGCRFHTRCPFAEPVCQSRDPV